MALQLWFPLAKNAYNYGAQKVIGYLTSSNYEDITQLPPTVGSSGIQDGGAFGTHFVHPQYQNFAPVVNKLNDTDELYITNFTSSVWLKCTTTNDVKILYDFSPELGAFSLVTFYVTGSAVDDRTIKIRTALESEEMENSFEHITQCSWDVSVWHHFCTVYNGSDLKFYLDNELIDTMSDAADIKFINGQHSMWFEISDNWCASDWRWYDEALTREQIEELYYHGDYPSILYTLGLVEPNDIAADNRPTIPTIRPATIEKYLSEYIDWYYRISSANIPHFMNIPTTNKIYDVDLDARIITPPKNVGLATDQRAEVIYFKMDRFYRGYDLSKSIGLIEYINAVPERHIYGIPFYDCITANKINPYETYDEEVCQELREDKEKVIFPWVISSDVTKRPGQVTFAMSFYVLDENGETVLLQVNLQPTTTIVQENIDIDPRIPNLVDDFTIPTVEQLLVLFKSIHDTDYGLMWDEGVIDNDKPTSMPYLQRMTLPQ